jgi:hypothetical protein
MKIDILGSCVTRDVLRYENPFTLGRYYARTSLVSLYSEPIKIELSEIDLPSSFLQKMVYYDLTKDFRNYMKWSDSDVLVLDFIDERFTMLKLGNSYITHSNEFAKSKLNEKLEATRVGWGTKQELWKANVLKFIDEVKSNYKTVVLHKAYWKDKYYDKNGVLHDYKNKPIEEKNRDLDFFYDLIQSQFEELKVIQLDQYVASENHVWGLTPYHYEDNYYIEFINQLNNLIKDVT